MTEIPDAWVEKAAAALRGVEESWGDRLPASETRMRARAVLAAVADDLAPTVDRAALAEVLHRHRTFDYRRHDGWVCTCGPLGYDGTAAGAGNLWQRHRTDAILAAGIVADAAKVRADARREVAEEIAAAVKEAHATCLENVKCEHDTAYHEGIYHVERLLTARIACEAGGHDG